MLYTRTDGLPQPVATSDFLNLYLLENGNLEVRLPGPEAKEVLAEIREKAADFNQIWAELFEDSRLTGNNWYPCQTFALSSATNICYGAIYDDDEADEPSDFENIWIFDDYWKTDEFEELFEGRSIIFSVVPADKEPNDFEHPDTGEHEADAVVALYRPPFYTLSRESKPFGERRTIGGKTIKFWRVSKNDEPFFDMDAAATEAEAKAVLAALQFAHIKTSREHLLDLLKDATEDVSDYLEHDLLTLKNDDPEDGVIVGDWHEKAKAIFA